ncbi:MAG: DUF4922 domain-containing protein [Bacteroides sp.]|nr:DUF4922 domain-containing protein [Bacteroides sp.]
MLDRLGEFRDSQLTLWPEAKKNYDALERVERKAFTFGPFTCYAQMNPARKVSTGARIDAKAIAARPCFLCRKNRPDVQEAEPILDGWEFLVNPFPIFPLHFTIASVNHIPQGGIPLEMASMAERLPGMTVFFNGARAGASAPDHLHCQAVATLELPLMRYLEEGGDPAELPFKVAYRVVTPDLVGMKYLAELKDYCGIDAATSLADAGLVNAFMWIGGDGLLRYAVVPRRRHRPLCYSADGLEGFMISPGAIDMAGVMVVPREEDFRRLTADDVTAIHADVALPSGPL